MFHSKYVYSMKNTRVIVKCVRHLHDVTFFELLDLNDDSITSHCQKNCHSGIKKKFIPIGED